MDETTPGDPSVTRAGTRFSAPPRGPESSVFDDGGFTPGTLLLNRYRIVGLIGRGGMGEVYRAQDLKLGQSVALKFLPQSVQRDPLRLERFLNEVRIARQISHPNVCRVYDVADVDGRHFISMEFVDGEDLASLLRRIGRLPPDKGVETARQICAGLAAAHDRGILHRDLKPANIMIDGRGQARLADFGLAAGVDDLRRTGEVAGTPAYMAPEQIEGREVSTRTDIFALGLVLHELFTGKRYFAEGSLQELRDAHRTRQSGTSSITSSSVELDPAVERVIERCLDPDPARRPPSALAVAAALPGGDPLAAALAAGETPSPDLVAGAGSVGALLPGHAWALLAALVLGTLANTWMAGQLSALRLAPAMRSPDVLASRAEDLLDRVGYGGLRADSTFGWAVDHTVVRHVRQSDQGHDRWERLAAADAPAIRFWYRQSPVPIVPYDYSSDVAVDDPPLLTPGMVTVVLTPRGRLVSFRAVPPARDERLSEESGTPDWAPFLAAAGINAAALTPTLADQIPASFATTRAAWEGRYPDRSDWPVRVEAAALGDRPLSFEVTGPWATRTTTASGEADFWTVARNTTQVVVILSALVLGAWMARRNARAGRTDAKGALVVAFCAAVPVMVQFVVGGHHTTKIDDEFPRFIVHLGLTLYHGAQFWLIYLALEPYVRRRWPEALISWMRLVGGRYRDPLVSRDVLIGLVGGTAIVLLGGLAQVAPSWAGRPPVSPTESVEVLEALTTPGAYLAALAMRPARALSEGLLILYLLLLSLTLFRNRWLAYGALTILFILLALNREAPVLSALSLMSLLAIMVYLISRFGLLSYLAAMFVLFAVNELPLTLDTSVWFAGRSAVTALLLAALALGTFWTALGGRSAMRATTD